MSSPVRQVSELRSKWDAIAAPLHELLLCEAFRLSFCCWAALALQVPPAGWQGRARAQSRADRVVRHSRVPCWPERSIIQSGIVVRTDTSFWPSASYVGVGGHSSRRFVPGLPLEFLPTAPVSTCTK